MRWEATVGKFQAWTSGVLEAETVQAMVEAKEPRPARHTFPAGEVMVELRQPSLDENCISFPAT